MGVNQFGLLVAVTNRPKAGAPWSRALARPALPRSVGSAKRPRCRRLCREGAFHGSLCRRQLLVCAVPTASSPLSYTAETPRRGSRTSSPGLYTLTNGNLNDPARRASRVYPPYAHAAHAGFGGDFPGGRQPGVLPRKPDSEGRRGVVVTGADYGTVSSTLLSLSRKIQHSIYQYSSGPPSDYPYDDLSALLLEVLSAGRSRKAAASNGAR